ncbi:MAG: NifU family protein [bacterium]
MKNKEELDISAMPTPNPNAIKFLINRKILEKGSLTFTKNSDVEGAILAKELLDINGIEQVMFGCNFIAVTKTDVCGWEDVLEDASNTIKRCITENEIILSEELLNNLASKSEDDSEVVKTIKQILDDEIRPAIAMDGGDCQFYSYENGILTLELQGACSTCPSSTMTLKMGIESRIKESVPDLVEVVQL